MGKTKSISINNPKTTFTKPKRSLYDVETKIIRRNLPISQHEYYQQKGSIGKLG